MPLVKPEPKLIDEHPRLRPHYPADLPALSSSSRWPLRGLSAALFCLGFISFWCPLWKKKKAVPAYLAAKSERKKRYAQAITLADVTKQFGPFTALQGFNLEINFGESVAFWGSNGAGKTTLLRCILGLIPYTGSILVDGVDPLRNGKAVKRLVGYLPQNPQLYGDFTVKESLSFFSRLRGLSESSIPHTLGRVDLHQHLQKKVKELSGGMRQKLALSIALLGDPIILILDEPTVDLDASSRKRFLELLGGLKAEGNVLVLASHRMEEIKALADRVVFLKEGKKEMESKTEDKLKWKEKTFSF